MTQSDEAAGEAPTPTVRLYDRRTLLQLSKSEHVHVPQGMASFEEWYGPWRPYTPRSHPPMMGGRRDGGVDGGGMLFSRRDMPREGRGGRRALLDGAKGASASATMVPGPRARNGGKLRTEKEADDGRTWRRVDDAAPRAASGMPAWMAEESTAARPVGGVETIEAFKAQMREMERRERGEPATPVAGTPSGKAKRSEEPDTETETETSSRFARFFDTKSDSKATSQAPSSQNVGGLDLFGMFQTMQKRVPPSMSAPESPAAPAAHAAPVVQTAPGTPTAPMARPSGPAVRPTPPAGARPSPPSAPPAPLAAPPSEGPVDGLPKPSAADMASMQMLMAKLMGRPAATPESRGSPRPPASAPPEAPPGLGARPPGPSMGMYPRPMPGPGPPGAPMSQMDFLQSLLRTSAPGAAGAAGAASAPPPPPPGLYPGQLPSWPQGPPYAGMPLHPSMPMPISAPPGLGGEAHGAGSGWRPPPGRPL
ncbi:hypothetical protein MEQU1_003620 [Malassezia equina]|uniref:Uncharacterized protein n=1 Tax=Malassezia equina TaxID=1381935 RepID=A0AAF0EHQ3_9BASI|nr:hypothetical protein MEQU1_003620 [Malassezia equina]